MLINKRPASKQSKSPIINSKGSKQAYYANDCKESRKQQNKIPAENNHRNIKLKGNNGIVIKLGSSVNNNVDGPI